MGYFWLPCPVCGKMFGGHEVGDGTLWESKNPRNGIRKGRSICPDCEKIKREWFEGVRIFHKKILYGKINAISKER